MEIKIKELNQGDKFEYGAKSAIVLDKMGDGVLCMVVDERYETVFDKANCNNFANSTLMTELHDDYLNRWINAGASLDDFVTMKVDLTADDGLDDYGSCKCYLAPRTCDQFRKYRKLIPKYNGWELTATAYSVESNGYANYVRVVGSGGSLSYSNAYESGGVRPLFKLKFYAEIEIGGCHSKPKEEKVTENKEKQNKEKLCPFKFSGKQGQEKCQGEMCAFWCEFANGCAVLLLAGMFADSGICQNVFKED